MHTRLACCLLPMSLAACSDYGVESIDGNPDGAGERLLQVWPEALDFGEVAAGDMVTDSFTITSTGTATVELEPLHVQGLRRLHLHRRRRGRPASSWRIRRGGGGLRSRQRQR